MYIVQCTFAFVYLLKRVYEYRVWLVWLLENRAKFMFIWFTDKYPNPICIVAIITDKVQWNARYWNKFTFLTRSWAMWYIRYAVCCMPVDRPYIIPSIFKIMKHFLLLHLQYMTKIYQTLFNMLYLLRVFIKKCGHYVTYMDFIWFHL